MGLWVKGGGMNTATIIEHWDEMFGFRVGEGRLTLNPKP